MDIMRKSYRNQMGILRTFRSPQAVVLNIPAVEKLGGIMVNRGLRPNDVNKGIARAKFYHSGRVHEKSTSHFLDNLSPLPVHGAPATSCR